MTEASGFSVIPPFSGQPSDRYPLLSVLWRRKTRESGTVVLEEDLGINSAGVRISYHLPTGHVGQVSSTLSVPICKMESMLPASELLLKMK